MLNSQRPQFPLLNRPAPFVRVQQPDIQVRILDGLSIGFEVGEGSRHSLLRNAQETIAAEPLQRAERSNFTRFSYFCEYYVER